MYVYDLKMSTNSFFVCRVTDTDERVGYLINMHSSELIQDEDKRLMACVDYFFIQVCSDFKGYLY